MNRHVLFLAACQALLTTGNILLVAVSGLIGQQLAPSPSWITMPIALQFIGLMLATIPASLIMAKIGRKAGFVSGNLIGIGGAFGCIVALQNDNFTFFCVGTFFLGIGIGFGTLYRFAALEVCSPESKSRAISTIMAGGVLAAFLGPNLAIYSQSWLPANSYLGAFYGLMGLYALALLLLTRIQFAHHPDTPITTDTPRPWRDIIAQPIFKVAVIAASASYVVMNLIMTATPLAMHHHGYLFSQSALVIEWHVLGMFAPSFITGRLIDKYGLLPVMLVGALLMMTCVAINLHGTSVTHFTLALTLLGVGWNFMFIGATQLVTSSYSPSEKAKTQASNEFVVFSLVTLSALSAGWLEATFGWQMVNLLSLPILLFGFSTLWIYYRQQKKQAAIA